MFAVIISLLLRKNCLFFFQAEDGIRYVAVTVVQTCALPILEERGMDLERLQLGLAALPQPVVLCGAHLLHVPARLPVGGDLPAVPSYGVRPRVIAGEIGRASCRERVYHRWIVQVDYSKTQYK